MKKNTMKSKNETYTGTGEQWRTNNDCSKCSNKCACATCPLRVLVVGGIERMESRYRELVEGKGHIFEYHAGHQRKGGNKLDNCLLRADVVLCPVNCNSHTACLQVKKLCKKYGKNLHMMRNFSLTALGSAIELLH